MNPDNALPMLLPVAGVVLQFVVRQFKSLPDTLFYLIAVSLATGVYSLVTPASGCAEWRSCTTNYLAWMAIHFTSLLGGTAMASNAAKGYAKINPQSAQRNPLCPLTDSK